MVGVECPDGTLCYAGMEVCHTSQRDPGRLRVGGRLGGRGEQILDAACHPTVFDSTSIRLSRPVSEDVLQAWCEVEVLTPVVLDSVQVCPRCRALPTFRPGCRSCGSGRVVGEQLIHHFACAYVAPIADFERPEGLVCPKCRARKLVVGSDYEYQIGATRCPDCQWHGAEPQQVGQCLMCHFRFPGGQALRLELKGYHVHRLDPLAFIAAS
jgi:ribosomal protein L40E